MHEFEIGDGRRNVDQRHVGAQRGARGRTREQVDERHQTTAAAVAISILSAITGQSAIATATAIDIQSGGRRRGPTATTASIAAAAAAAAIAVGATMIRSEQQRVAAEFRQIGGTGGRREVGARKDADAGAGETVDAEGG